MHWARGLSSRLLPANAVLTALTESRERLREGPSAGALDALARQGGATFPKADRHATGGRRLPIDWSAAASRLEAALAALERRGLVIDGDLAAAALARCVRYAVECEPPGESLSLNDPLFDLICRYDLNFD